jgi:hypothetical protein
MGSPMTIRAKRDQIFMRVVPEVASRSDVMDFEILRTATLLAPPAIPHQNLPVKLCVRRTIQLTPRTFLAQRAHAGFRRSAQNLCRRASGKS